METNKHGKSSGSTFFWGFIIGVTLATLLCTKKGRQILRDLIDLALELVEEIIEDKKQKRTLYKRVADETAAAEDIESEIAEVESSSPAASDEVFGEPKKNGNGHSKKRMFRGIKKQNKTST